MKYHQSMPAISFVLCLCLLSLSTGISHGQAIRAEYRAETYDSLLTRLLAGDTDIDYTALRLSYTKTKYFDPYSEDERRQRGMMLKARYDEDFERAQLFADSLLRDNYAHLDAHMVAATVAEARHDSARADYHENIALGLINSIKAGNSGISPDSPFVVISISEEYAFLRIAGMKLQTQALADCIGKPCDIMNVLDYETQDTLRLYFDVSILMEFLAGSLNQ